MSARAWVTSAVLGGVLFGAMSESGHAPASGGGTALTMAAVPAAGSYTPASWASAFLGVIGEPRTSCDLGAIEGWEDAESGGDLGTGLPDDPDVTHNPLNTARGEPGSYAINSDGVQSYPSWSEGLQANAAAITNGLYGGILAALQAGNNAQNVADQVTDSPWGTGGFAATC